MKSVIHKLYLAVMSVLMRFMPPLSFFVFSGEKSAIQLCQHIARQGIQRLLIVSDKPLVELGLVEPLKQNLQDAGVDVTIYDGVLPDPTFAVVEGGLELLKQSKSEAVLAIGGGSSIDTGKTIASAATNGFQPKALAGYFKVKIAPLPLFAIPTTSGTGSEVTVGAVIADSDTHEKSYVADPKMLPQAVALDPTLITGLPPHITAATGMDALTHAIESYISCWANPRSESYALSAVKMVFASLQTACSNGADVAARGQMSLAACYAGLAINDTNIGNVHAIAHQFGRVYSTPHGLANAVVLPYVLRFTKQASAARLANLARAVGLAEASTADSAAADAFIAGVVALNDSIGIPRSLEKLKQADFDNIIDAAVNEGRWLPVPILMDKQDCEAILRQCLSA
ncbi:iron-containing alcohol dehydrogenase [Spongiibacter sp. KMU-158]|uniref:Iron-containing alcohol dehydrogenase n=1 Tax=Spongiibacter pelagi TaxID=2760804 RepID=A0A927C306_9GAMM|nr:iron-containing alcohol dehydrogenase [Spongiibacter pelagi]MBD2858897.1 iron-containing alcohol dehydrogenase [Spongiibacter pelagi]